MPEVSVIMGVHNGGRFLAAAVASVQAQTFSDWELVIIENGSTDGAVDALEAANQDLRVRIFRQAAALTPGGALVVACREARGRYLAVLDHDDLAMPNRLELQRAYLELQPDVVLLGGMSELIDAEDRPLGLEQFVGTHEEIHALVPYVHALRHSSIMFRRELLDKVQYRALCGIGSDHDFFARASEVGRVAALPVKLCRYRLHQDNRSSHVARSAVNSGLVRMLARRRRCGLSEDLETWAEQFVSGAEGGNGARAHLHCARLFAGEGHDDLAAFHAWLAIRHGGGWRAVARYLQVVLRGLPQARGAGTALAKAWLKEPVHQLLRAGGAPDRHQF